MLQTPITVQLCTALAAAYWIASIFDETPWLFLIAVVLFILYGEQAMIYALITEIVAGAFAKFTGAIIHSRREDD